jgi:hypothetical protein
VVAGPGRGEAFLVCVNKEKCDGPLGGGNEGAGEASQGARASVGRGTAADG